MQTVYFVSEIIYIFKVNVTFCLGQHLKIGKCRQFTLLVKLYAYSRSMLLFALANMTLAKGNVSKTKSGTIHISAH